MKKITLTHPWSSCVFSGICDVVNVPTRLEKVPGRYLVRCVEPSYYDMLPLEMEQEIFNSLLFGTYVQSPPSGYFMGWIEIESCLKNSKSIWNLGDEFFKCHVSRTHLFEKPVKSEVVAQKLARQEYECKSPTLQLPKLESSVLHMNLNERKFNSLTESSQIAIELTSPLAKMLTNFAGRLKKIALVKFYCKDRIRVFAVDKRSQTMVLQNSLGTPILFRSCKSRAFIPREQAIIVLNGEFSPDEMLVFKDIL